MDALSLGMIKVAYTTELKQPENPDSDRREYLKSKTGTELLLGPCF